MFEGCVNSQVYGLICFHHAKHLRLLGRPRMCIGSLSKQEAQRTLMWFIVSMTSRHFEVTAWVMCRPNLVAPRLHCAQGVALPSTSPVIERISFCHSFTCLHTFTDGHRWNIHSVTLTHPYRQKQTHRKRANTKNSHDIPFFALTYSLCCSACVFFCLRKLWRSLASKAASLTFWSFHLF